MMGLAGNAAAQDVMVPPPAQNWSGMYLGVNFGGGVLNYHGPYGYYYAEDTIELNRWGATVGGTIGVNFQFGAGFFGLEGDLNWSRFNVDYDTPYSDPDSYYLLEGGWNWFGTLRARAGMAVDNALFYVTGGLALVNQDYYSCYNQDTVTGDCVPSSYDGEFDGTRLGFAVGVGTEFMIRDDVSVKLEYLHVRVPTIVVPIEGDPDYYAAQFNTAAHLLRLGFNFHF